jgi:hypothetical protein
MWQMAQISSLYEIRNVVLAHDALLALTSKPGAKMTITQSPFSVTVEFDDCAFTAQCESDNLNEALFNLAQQCVNSRRFKTAM